MATLAIGLAVPGRGDSDIPSAGGAGNHEVEMLGHCRIPGLQIGQTRLPELFGELHIFRVIDRTVDQRQLVLAEGLL